MRPALYAYWLVVPFAVIGSVLLYRRRVTLIPLFAQVLMVTFVAASAYGAVRFRIPAEVALIALAAVALDAGLTAIRPARPAAAAEEPAVDQADEGRMSRATHP